MKPTQMGRVKVAVFDDTCTNLIQIASNSSWPSNWFKRFKCCHFYFTLLLPATTWSPVCGIFFMVSKLFRRVEFSFTGFTFKTTNFFLTHTINLAIRFI
jgi:hypothetical protein